MDFGVTAAARPKPVTAVVGVRENPVLAIVVADVFAALNESAGAAAVGVTVLVRAKFAILGTVVKDVVVAVELPSPKPVPATMVLGVPKVMPVIPNRAIQFYVVYECRMLYNTDHHNSYFASFHNDIVYLLWILVSRRTIRYYGVSS